MRSEQIHGIRLPINLLPKTCVKFCLARQICDAECMMPLMIYHDLSISRTPRALFLARFALWMSLLAAVLLGCIVSPRGQHIEYISYPASQQLLQQHQQPSPPVHQMQQQSSQTEATCVSTSDFHADLLSRVNRIRAAGAVCGGVRYLPAAPMRWSNELQQAAAAHSRDMAEHNFFSHKSATNGTTLKERLHSVGYKFQAAAENIGAAPRTVAQALDMWVASPGHCANIMTASFVDMGVSCKYSPTSTYQYYWTLVMANR